MQIISYRNIIAWNLYLDDERTPKTERDWVIARSSEEAKNLVMKNGCPDYISFDHDLGFRIPDEMKDKNPSDFPMVETPIGYFREGVIIEETGLDFAKWLIEQDMNGSIVIPENFEYNVHSANPVGAKNIKDLMASYLSHRKQK
jgi:hypothetical protein